MECPIARAADELGDGWTLLILREAYKGARTFGDFAGKLPIAPTTLTRKLEDLVGRDFFTKRVYQEHPRRERYEPTPKAEDLLPVVIALGAWGNRWLAPNGDLLSVIDATTHAAIEVEVVDRKSRRPIRAGSVALEPGPGASAQLRRRVPVPIILGGAKP